MEKYLKLGEKASSYYDPTTKFNLIGDQVKVVLPFQLKSPRLKRFLQGGGLAYATKEEFKAFEASAVKTPELKVVEKNKSEEVEQTKKTEEAIAKKSVDDMTKDELYEHIKKSGWESVDIESGLAISKKSDLLEYVKDTELAYEDDGV